MKDITNTRRSLREVLPASQAPADDRPITDVVSGFNNSGHIVYHDEAGTGPGKKFWIALLVFVLLIVSGYVFARFFAVMEIQITPKDISIQFDDNYQATKDDLLYDVISKVEETASVTVPASGSKHVERKASGKVTIFNRFSGAAQRLVAGTRLETEAGKIYRLQSAVVVPGMKDAQPGSVSVAVLADKPGSDYNNPSGELRLVGFKGTNKYDKFAAQVSDGAIVSGGFSGEEKVISAQDKAKAIESLKAGLATKVLSKARHQIPDKYVLYGGATVVDYTETTSDSSAGEADRATLALTASLKGIIFEKASFAKFLAAGKNIGFGAPILIKDYDSINISLDPKYNIEKDSASSVKFQVSGKPTFVAQIDETDLLNKLSGTNRGEFSSVFGQFPAISRASVSYRPSFVRFMLVRPASTEVVLNGQK